jgi:hypothetical protein
LWPQWTTTHVVTGICCCASVLAKPANPWLERAGEARRTGGGARVAPCQLTVDASCAIVESAESASMPKAWSGTRTSANGKVGKLDPECVFPT